MQVYVLKSDLVNSPVPVVAYYNDTKPPMDITFHGSLCTMFNVPVADVQFPISAPVPGTPPLSQQPNLIPSFRNDMQLIVNAEANRRILLVFSEEQQRNSNADINRSTTLYGATTSAWPSDAQSRLTESNRGWSYVNLVRQASVALGTNLSLVDPTDDSHWPTRITPPIYIAPV